MKFTESPQSDVSAISIEHDDTQSLMRLGMVFAKSEECQSAVELIERARGELSFRGAALPDDVAAALDECRAATR